MPFVAVDLIPRQDRFSCHARAFSLYDPLINSSPRCIRAKWKVPAKDGIGDFAKLELTDSSACSSAAKVMAVVWKNEEARFNNLNTRGATLLSATALVTTILGFYAKNLFDTSLSRVRHDVGVWGASVSIGLLVVSAGIVLFGVLSPSRAFVFGGNELTNGANPGMSARDVDKITYDEYATIFVNLANRSRRKGYFLWLAYWPFAVAVLISGVTTVIVILMRNPPPPAH